MILALFLAACELPPAPAPAPVPATGGPVTVIQDPGPATDYAAYTLGALALPAGTWPMGLAFVGESLWVADLRSQGLLELDPGDGTLRARHPHDGLFPAGLAAAGDTLYATDLWDDDRIQRLAPDAADHPWPLPWYETWAWGVAASPERLYALDARNKKIIAIDLVDGSELYTFAAPGKRPAGLCWDGRWLWSADIESRRLFMLDPERGWVLHSLPSPARHPSGLTERAGDLWVSDLETSQVFQARRFAEAPYVEDQAQRYRVSFRLDLVARGEGALRDVEVAIALPETRPGQVILAEPSFSDEPSEMVTEPSGQRLALFHVPSIGSGEDRQVSMELDVEVRRVRWQLDPDAVPALPVPLPLALSPALADGRKLDMANASIVERARRAAGDEQNPYLRARRIYEDLVDAIRYDRSGGWGAAPTVLARGSGSCSEYTFALLALWRAAGIPCRYVGALVRRGPTSGVDFVFHRWAEVWLGERWGWVAVDPNAGSSEVPEERGAAFGGLDGRFLVTTVSYGESEHLDWSYGYAVTSYRVEGSARLEEQPVAVWVPLGE
ncbi:MAG: transglutaminase domain-containing protein [Pseudomonadota bacterium]